MRPRTTSSNFPLSSLFSSRIKSYGKELRNGVEEGQKGGREEKRGRDVEPFMNIHKNPTLSNWVGCSLAR